MHAIVVRYSFRYLFNSMANDTYFKTEFSRPHLKPRTEGARVGKCASVIFMTTLLYRLWSYGLDMLFLPVGTGVRRLVA